MTIAPQCSSSSAIHALARAPSELGVKKYFELRQARLPILRCAPPVLHLYGPASSVPRLYHYHYLPGFP